MIIARIVGAAALACASMAGLTTGTAHASPDRPTGEGILYGDPAAAAPFWRYQQYDDDCVEMAVADVVGELTGRRPSEQSIVKLAQATPSTVHPGPIYTKPTKRKPGSGTAFGDEPALLAHYGIHAVDTDDQKASKTGAATGVSALERYLARGRKVIVAVNAELIWREPVEDTTPDGRPASNHAVVVTGVDAAAAVVHLNDSGIEDGRDEQVPMDVFVRSWATGDDEMTVTA
ncbi:Papain-like cysteine protease AvrRpt2 [Mycobacterium bohemicum DSM 44277]|uniref:Peptidase C39-like domain-containing protein n=2 Tax=Mycobacterium bohemicum TaxID=56425 RepID=A0A1X1R5R9_MYCBE|nr:C39 family peptidase [Mycobacterium bohemicum]MCV6971079.1 hypothetical protein [Mycobacterium bohemicum]ORV00111.1 hypothetical protein AWB93_09805 [Mycobacterium bohemicum]CPR13136.1 Papain-like cysteine protease AvrRpt2 [Mycobacterium bohemicum DSM 44277]